jgi:hypothetical protein
MTDERSVTVVTSDGVEHTIKADYFPGSNDQEDEMLAMTITGYERLTRPTWRVWAERILLVLGIVSTIIAAVLALILFL